MRLPGFIGDYVSPTNRCLLVPFVTCQIPDTGKNQAELLLNAAFVDTGADPVRSGGPNPQKTFGCEGLLWLGPTKISLK